MLNRISAVFALSFGGVIAFGGPAFAHPHVTVTVRTQVQFDAKGLVTGLRHVWRFDEAFSSYASAGMDVNKDGKLSREELEPLAKVNVESLKEFKYFTSYWQGKTEQAFDEPTEHWLEHDGQALTLNFALPLKTPLRPTSSDRIEVYDASFFVNYGFALDNPVTVSGDAKGCAIALDKPKEPATGRLSQLSESFFSSLSPGSNFGGSFAVPIRFKCP